MRIRNLKLGPRALNDAGGFARRFPEEGSQSSDGRCPGASAVDTIQSTD